MATGAPAGFSPSRLQHIDRLIQTRYIDTGKIPCAQLLIARRGEVVHSSVLGLADLERATALREDTVFRIYSMTKPITSVAFMMLVEAGQAALDDPVEKYIPQWRDLGVFLAGGPGAWQTSRPARPMLIIDLLRHTSGLTYGIQKRSSVDATYRRLGIGEPGSTLSLEAMIGELAVTPLEFSPGEAWNYSVSTDVLGYLIQTITGQPFADFVRGRILGPLNMTDTDFQVAAGKAHRLAACYNRGPQGELLLQDDPAVSRYLSPPEFYSGGGGLVSTAADYLKFCQMLLAGGQANGVRFIGRKTLRFMTLNHLPGGRDLTEMSRSMFSEATNAGVGFGLGFAVAQDLTKTLIAGSIGEYYWGGAAGTAFWVDPSEDLAVVFMTQLLGWSVYPIRRELRSMVYAAIDD